MTAIAFDTLKFVERLRADMIKWMAGLAMAQMGLLIGILVKLLQSAQAFSATTIPLFLSGVNNYLLIWLIVR